jgi:hypothetical protein
MLRLEPRPSNLPIRPHGPLGIVQQPQDRPALVLIGPSLPVIGITAHRARVASVTLGTTRSPRGLSRRARQARRPNVERRNTMADDKTKRGGADRRRVAGDEGYEVGYFAKKHGISRDDAQAIIKRVGNNREKLNEAARKHKR